MPLSPKDVMKLAADNGVKIVDFRFVDPLGSWQHTSKSLSDVDEDVFERRRRRRRLVDPQLPGHQRARHAEDAGP